MLKVPQLDDLTYEQMIQRAVSRIPTMTDQWTDFNSHDPGITVLQMYAWLTDMLNYYMNATGDIHVQKYLKLLGIEPEKEQASEGYLVVEGNQESLQIPSKTRFYAGNIPFETISEQHLSENRFCSCINEVDGNAMDLTAFAGKDGDFAETFAMNFEREAVVYLGFEHGLQFDDRLYINVKEDKHRTPFGMDFELSHLAWEYYTQEGWQTLPVEDDTCGFLRTGFLHIRSRKEHKPWKHPQGEREAYYIRCILTENQYDVLPALGMIYVNPLKVVQQQTICGSVPSGLRLGKTNGCAGQTLEFDYPDVYHFELLLWDEQKTAYTDGAIWIYTENLEQADYKDHVFTWDAEQKEIRFGDGIHGAVPEQGMDVEVIQLTGSCFSGGNVLAGEINRTDFPQLLGCRISNPEATFGGRERESVREMLERMEETLLAQERMASAEDYVKRILATPGLMLDLVHVIPGRLYGKLHRQERGLNEVVAVVKPYGSGSRPKLGSVYREMIEHYIEPYRLLNTKVSIESCEYVGIEVHGRILLHHDTEEVRTAIHRCLEEETDYHCRKKPFGMTISYGRVFTRLEAIEGVKQVQSLSLERVGRAAEKNDSKDILLHEDALAILEKIDLEYS
jgi:predicted phage baseplate assembly protein